MAERDNKELVERLRGYRSRDEWGDPVHHTICDEAAEAVSALQAEVERLTRERDEALKALEQIAAIEPVSNCDAGSMARSRMRDIARYSIARRPK